MTNKEKWSLFKNKLRLNEQITDEQIFDLAMETVRRDRQAILNFFLSHTNNHNRAIFMAGSPGAGKTEYAETFFPDFNIIDPDKVRCLLPFYKGSNSFLFHKAASKAVDYLFDTCLKKKMSFVLDGNFVNLKQQQLNVQRCLQRGYEVEVYFVYQAPELALQHTCKREDTTGRHVPEKLFVAKTIGAIETTKQIIRADENLAVNFVDVRRQKVINNIEAAEFTRKTELLLTFCEKFGVTDRVGKCPVELE
jgi:predicted kinase